MILDHLHALTAPAAHASPTRHADILAALADIAAAYGVAILAILHLNKTPSGRMLYRARGTVGYVAAARSVLYLSTDPAEPATRVLTTIKSIHAAPPPPAAFRIATRPAAPSARPPVDPSVSSSLDPLARSLLPDSACPVLEWLPAAPSTPADLLDLAPAAQSALADACAFLADALSAGPRAAADVLAEGRVLGLSARTLHRAKRALSVRSFRSNEPAGWLWALAGPAGEARS